MRKLAVAALSVLGLLVVVLGHGFAGGFWPLVFGLAVNLGVAFATTCVLIAVLDGCPITFALAGRFEFHS